MKAPHREVYDRLFDTLEPIILAEMEKTGLPLVFALHVSNTGGPGGSVLCNLPIEQQVRFAEYCLEQTKRAVAIATSGN